MNKQSGSLLLDVLLAIAITSTVAAASLHYYFQYYHQVEVNQLGDRIDNMFESLNVFYNVNCFDGLNPAPTVADLVAIGNFTVTDSANPFGGVLTPSVAWGVPSRLQVSAVFSPEDLQSMINTFNPSGVAGNTLTWSEIPSTFTDSSEGEQQIYRNMYMAECN